MNHRINSNIIWEFDFNKNNSIKSYKEIPPVRDPITINVDLDKSNELPLNIAEEEEYLNKINDATNELKNFLYLMETYKDLLQWYFPPPPPPTSENPEEKHTE